MIPQLPPSDLAAWLADSARPAPAIVDVREPWEFARCHIDGALSIPLGQLPGRVGEIPAAQPLVLVCHHGSRSQQAAMWLARNGRVDVHNLRGGVEGWALEVDRAMPRY